MKLNDYLEIKTELLQELKAELPEERRKVIFEELVSLNRVLKENECDEKIRACMQALK